MFIAPDNYTMQKTPKGSEIVSNVNSSLPRHLILAQTRNRDCI